MNSSIKHQRSTNCEGGKGMEILDLMTEIERYISRRGLTHSDSIETLIEAMVEELQED